MILEALHRAPELTRRMLRGVIADAAFRTFVVPAAESHGWRDVTPEGNFAYDYKMDDGQGPVTVQVKLQRSERGAPVVKAGQRFGFEGEVFMTETQKTRTGTDGDEKTRPYRYGGFDVLAVSMQPSTEKWDSYMYSLGRWLLPGKKSGEMATMQPVTKKPSAFWTDDFATAAAWFRAGGRRQADDDCREGESAASASQEAGQRVLPSYPEKQKKHRKGDLFSLVRRAVSRCFDGSQVVHWAGLQILPQPHYPVGNWRRGWDSNPR